MGNNNKIASLADAEGDFAEYRFEPGRYIREKLGWKPWGGSAEMPGQGQILEAYTLALRQQHERADFEAGRVSEGELRFWKPGMVIRNWIRVEAGHAVGKSKLASGLVNHFFDCFAPSVIYTFAPTWKQIHDVLWKEIKSDRRGKGLPGRILDLELRVDANHFANGVAASNAGGHGTERVQGQHNKYLMFVLDEAEGIADFVFDAVNSMDSGGTAVIVALFANPRTRVSRFYKLRELSRVVSFRISCLWHPNVVEGREVVSGAVRRDYVEGMIEEHCEAVVEASEDDHTFVVPWRDGVIFRPDAEFLFRALGIAPANSTDDTFVPVGRYEAACRRTPPLTPPRNGEGNHEPTRAWMGIDAAGYGNDVGTIYVRHSGAIWRAAECSKRAGDQDPTDYWQKARRAALELAERGAKSLHVRIDAGGGFGDGVFDRLQRDAELTGAFADFQLVLVHFNGRPRNSKAYANLATEMYAEAAESLKGLAILHAPPALETDLCERRFDWVNKAGVEVKAIEQKRLFRKRQQRSPDDGDGFVLCAAPDFLFGGALRPAVGGSRPAVARYRQR